MNTYFERGGLRWGTSFWWGWNATWPFATLLATDYSLEIAVGVGPLGRRFTFNRLEIERISLKNGIFSGGVRLAHFRKDYPPFIQFWTFQPQRLLSELALLGYPLDGAERRA